MKTLVAVAWPHDISEKDKRLFEWLLAKGVEPVKAVYLIVTLGDPNLKRN